MAIREHGAGGESDKEKKIEFVDPGREIANDPTKDVRKEWETPSDHAAGWSEVREIREAKEIREGYESYCWERIAAASELIRGAGAELMKAADQFADPALRGEARNLATDLPVETDQVNREIKSALAQDGGDVPFALVMSRIEQTTSQVSELMNRSGAAPAATQSPTVDAGPAPDDSEQAEAARTLLRRICENVKGWFGDLLRSAWRLFTSMMKPKEWKAKVSAGVAELEITFGR